MTSREIGLGNLEHIKDSQNLKLRTHVALTFSHISSSTISDPIQIESLLSTDTWIAGANRLHIHSHFLFDDVQVSDHENVTFVEEIGLRFRSAEVHSSTLLSTEYLIIPRSGLSLVSTLPMKSLEKIPKGATLETNSSSA